ncbi:MULTISPECIES: ATP-binding protein [unclassified Burkholderia]|uniref:AAA family ATPase n=1 Tax=unclassified Burkholderia TaxID=2613784 RepID=UPI00142442A3|nr:MULTISPECIES: ATP-binding protein [unclassified Burkholderia]NIE58655.1 ATP-binding protein [Burkholderia sp. Ap-955]NIF10144.1 ATP-binding protein [Burkholderia sp. Ax-1735]NIG03595.1 ATP-binding protein [Burkholderia sp. Tr-849]
MSAVVEPDHRDTTVPTDYSQLLAALGRLDELLAVAIGEAGTVDDTDPAGAFYRGLQINAADVERILAGRPAQPWFRPNMSTDALASIGAIEVPKMAWLMRAFGLTGFDVDVVLLALAPELDLRYEKLYAYLQDDVTRRRPSVELALDLFSTSAEDKLALRSRFSADAPLVRHRVVLPMPDLNRSHSPLLAHELKLDEQIVQFLLGDDALDRRLVGYCRMLETAACGEVTEADRGVHRALAEIANDAGQTSEPLRLYFRGASAVCKLSAVQELARARGARILVVELARCPLEANYVGELLQVVFREAWLRNAVIYLDGFDAWAGAEAGSARTALADLLAADEGIVILSGIAPWTPCTLNTRGVLELAFDVFDRDSAMECWRTELSHASIELPDAGMMLLGDRFRLTAEQIADAVRCAAVSARWAAAQCAASAAASGTADGASEDDLERLCAAARAECGHELNRLARKITPRYTWDDIVLPADGLEHLREVCEQAKHAHTVYGRWGFGRKLALGKGLNVLFSGPPGTGKTMAADVLAKELRLDLYKIDLSQIVSKYIGDTEKNLDHVFSVAEHSNAILFFDEADTLFGKRSEVKDSHDRYANIEVGYLLQKMEEYEGIAILATNARHHLDDAFVRRMQVIIEFPFPEEAERRRVWQTVFPRETPLGDDVDFAALARTVRLAGGNIKSIACAAAFYAAADGGAIHMPHLMKASRREYQKLGRTLNDIEWNGVSVPVTSRGRA